MTSQALKEQRAKLWCDMLVIHISSVAEGSQDACTLEVIKARTPEHIAQCDFILTEFDKRFVVDRCTTPLPTISGTGQRASGRDDSPLILDPPV